jgi:hypothetical protein
MPLGAGHRLQSVRSLRPQVVAHELYLLRAPASCSSQVC